MRAGFKWAVIGIALLWGLLFAAAWWATSSPGALQWLVAEAVQRSQGKLAFEDVSGSLLGRVQVRKLVYSADDVRVTLDDVALALSRSALLQGRLEVVALEAAVVDIHVTPSDKPLQMPQSLALPFEIELQQVRVGQLHIKGQVIRQLAFAYRGGKAEHLVRDLVAETDWGHVNGEMKIAAVRPFVIKGKLQLDNPGEGNAQLDLSGDLLNTDLTARAVAKGAQGAAVDAKVRISPFDPRWLREVYAHGEKINAAVFKRDLPESAITFDLVGSGIDNNWLAGKVSITNAVPGTLTDSKLPLLSLSANYVLQDTATASLNNIVVDLGTGGKLSGKGRLAPDMAQFDLVVRAFNLRALHSPLRATGLNGSIEAEITAATQKLQVSLAERGVAIALNGSRYGDAITLGEFRVQAGSGVIRGDGKASLAGVRPFKLRAQINRFDPAAFGDYPSASITGQLDASGVLVPQWQANVALTLANSIFRGERLAGEARGEFAAQGVRNMKAELSVGANVLHTNGNYGRLGDTLTFALDAARLSQLAPDLMGALNAQGHVSSEAKEATLNIDAVGTTLGWQGKTRIDALRLHAGGSVARHTVTLTARGEDFDLDALIEGGWDANATAARGWSGALVSFQNRGIYPMQLQKPMPVAYAHGHYSAGPAQLNVASGRVALKRFAWNDGQLQTSGEINGFPAALLLAAAGMPAPRTTLRIGGAWSLSAAPLLNGQLTLVRESGDAVIPGDNPVALGLESLGVKLHFADGAADAVMDISAQNLSGNAHATVTSLSRDAKLKLDGKFDIASLRVLDPFLSSQALLSGSATVNVAGSGTLGSPQLGGSLSVANLGFEAPQYGARFHDGTLRAELDDKTLTLHEFSIQGDEGRLSATGTMARANGDANLVWQAEHLRVLNRSDMRLKFDGSGSAALAGKKLVLRGELTADEGRFEFDTPKAPQLADDIVVIGRPKVAARNDAGLSFQSRLLDVDVALDAGTRSHIVGAGLDTDLRGQVRLKTNPQGVLEARGVLSSVNGVYFVFGQRLDIERGRLTFDGPLDNPALDILAKRKGLAVEAGVQVTGSVRVPNVQLISDPPVSDSEKLAWLTLGHGLQDATGADLALLQTAASALINTGNAVPLTQRIANRIGLDELSLKGSGQAGSQVAAVGKRLSEKLYVEYQQGLATASSVLRLSYALSRTLSLRLDAGNTNGFGLYFTRSYD